MRARSPDPPVAEQPQAPPGAPPVPGGRPQGSRLPLFCHFGSAAAQGPAGGAARGAAAPHFSSAGHPRAHACSSRRTRQSLSPIQSSSPLPCHLFPVTSSLPPSSCQRCEFTPQTSHAHAHTPRKACGKQRGRRSSPRRGGCVRPTPPQEPRGHRLPPPRHPPGAGGSARPGPGQAEAAGSALPPGPRAEPPPPPAPCRCVRSRVCPVPARPGPGPALGPVPARRHGRGRAAPARCERSGAER